MVVHFLQLLPYQIYTHKHRVGFSKSMTKHQHTSEWKCLTYFVSIMFIGSVYLLISPKDEGFNIWRQMDQLHCNRSPIIYFFICNKRWPPATNILCTMSRPPKATKSYPKGSQKSHHGGPLFRGGASCEFAIVNLLIITVWTSSLIKQMVSYEYCCMLVSPGPFMERRLMASR